MSQNKFSDFIHSLKITPPSPPLFLAHNVCKTPSVSWRLTYSDWSQGPTTLSWNSTRERVLVRSPCRHFVFCLSESWPWWYHWWIFLSLDLAPAGPQTTDKISGVSLFIFTSLFLCTYISLVLHVTAFYFPHVGSAWTHRTIVFCWICMRALLVRPFEKWGNVHQWEFGNISTRT